MSQGHPFPARYGVGLPFPMNWQCVYVNILINREKAKSDLRYLGTPTPLGRGEKKKGVLESNLFCWCWGLMTIAKDK